MDNALMQGTYSDFKVIKGRKVIQMVIEFPIEQAEVVTSTFGIPQPHMEKWVAVALLKEQAAVKDESATKAIQVAGILCREPKFGNWLRDSRGMNEVIPDDPDSVADALRAICGIRSRADFNNNKEALSVFFSLKSSYDNYLIT